MKKKVLYFISAFWVLSCLFFACSQNDERFCSEDYEEEILYLEKMYGVTLEFAADDIVTSSVLEDIESILYNIKEQFKEPIVLLSENADSNSIVFCDENESLSIPLIMTRAENSGNVKNSYNSFNFIVHLSDNNATCTVSSTQYTIVSSPIDSKKIASGGDTITATIKMRVVVSGGNGYLHIPFTLKATWNKQAGNGTLKIEQK